MLYLGTTSISLPSISHVVGVMVVGYGFIRGRGRCFTLWKDFMTCAEKHGTYGANVCQAEREDYLECLHHTKLVCLC